MNKLGLVGGTGPGSTIPHYRDIVFDRPAARSPAPPDENSPAPRLGVIGIRVNALIDYILDGTGPVR